MTDLENVYKLNRYFYMDSNQNILKYILVLNFDIITNVNLFWGMTVTV